MIHQFWQRLNPRERVFVVSGLAVIVFLLGYVWGWQPLSAAVDQQQQQVIQQNALLQWMRQAKQRVSQLQAAGYTLPTVQSTSLLVTAESSLSAQQLSGFVREVQQPQQNQLQLTFQQVPFDRFITWLENMAKHTDSKVNEVKITPAEIAGTVDAILILHRDE